VRIALGDPDGPNVAERGEEEGIGDAMAAKIRNALVLYRPLDAVENIEIRLQRTVLYNSIYRADERLPSQPTHIRYPGRAGSCFLPEQQWRRGDGDALPRELRADM